MNQCPKCASNLTFDIKAQMFVCECCGTLIGAGRIEKEETSEYQESFEATVYSCPQCRGEIIYDDIATTTVCGYCGASVLMKKHIRRCKRPKYIIPFQKTQEDCQNAYKEMVKGAFFAPDEYKDEKQAQRFRAMYVPYWICNMGANRAIEFEGIRYSQRDSYRITHHVGFEARLLSEFKGLTLEASLAFPDRMSTQIEPFRLSEKKTFTAEYLSGFYADVNDVEVRDYEQIAQNIAVEACCKKFGEMHPLYEFEENAGSTSLKEALEVHSVEADLALFPVWFWSNRKEDRVAYGVMNGQTGKMALELPIDKKNFLKTALLVSIPFILFNFLFVMDPHILLGMLGFGALFLGILVNERTTQILENMFYEDFLMQVKNKDSERRKKHQWTKRILFLSGFGAIICMILLLGLRSWIIFRNNLRLLLELVVYLLQVGFFEVLVWATIGTCVFIGIRMKKNYRYTELFVFGGEAYEAEWKKNLMYLIKPILIVILAMIVLFINPVSAIAYYTTIIIAIGMMLWTIKDLVTLWNKWILHPSPEFENIGGDER